jgi:hypothetical protein
MMTLYREDNRESFLDQVPYFIIVHNQINKVLAVLNEKEIQEFVHGDREITGADNKPYKYSSYPGSMKPNLKKLDEFIGIDTTGKTY